MNWKGPKFPVAKIILILSEAKMSSVSSVCRKYDICSSIFYRWQKHYSGFSSEQTKRLAILESENESLKRILAELESHPTLDPISQRILDLAHEHPSYG